MWGLGLVSKFEPGLGLGGYGLDYIYVAKYSSEWSINKISKLFFTEFNARVNWIRAATRVGDKPSNQSLPRNLQALL